MIMGKFGVEAREHIEAMARPRLRRKLLETEPVAVTG